MDLFIGFTRPSGAARVIRSVGICAQCRRRISTSPMALSGHNKWSKIRHSKGIADKGKAQQRSQFAKSLALWSKLYGPDPTFNSQLATAIAAARKAGMPKAGIEAAIARGQGQSSAGTSLETALLEVMMPGSSVAMVLDIETDNKNRAIKDLKLVVKKHEGIVTPTTFLFQRLGRLVLSRKDGDADDMDALLEPAINAGAEDVEEDEDGIVIWTQPNNLHRAAKELGTNLEREILSSDIVWSPTSDKAKVDDEVAGKALGDMLAAMREVEDVQAIYANAEQGQVSEEVWAAIEENLD